jgi:hypothetical protein
MNVDVMLELELRFQYCMHSENLKASHGNAHAVPISRYDNLDAWLGSNRI